MRKTLTILGLMIVAAAFVFAGGQGEQAAAGAADGAEFILANGAEPESLDPHKVSGVPEHRILMGIFEGLVVPDPETAEAAPGVAESWDITNNGTVYTFHLRDDAVWSDGTPVTAQQFVDSWIRMLDPNEANPYAWFPSMFIKGAAAFNGGEADADAVAVEAVDDKTFRFETVGPLPYTLGALAHYSFAVVPLHAIEEYGDQWTLPENFVGNGPFTLESWRPQESITLVPNDTYWNKDKVELGRVTFLPVEEDTTMYNMYLNGEVDWATNVPNGQIDEAKLRDDYHANPQLATYYYVFQTQKPPINDPRVRKALSMAFDRQELIDTVTRAGQTAAFSIVPPMTGYPGIEGLGEDVEEAQQLLAEAGYPNGEGFPELTLLYNTSEGHKAIGEFIQQQWLENLNIDITLENQEWGTYLNTRRQGAFEVARAGWVGDYQDPNTFLDMFVTGGAMNGGKYSNPEYDELIEQAAQMPAGDDRMQVMADAERLLIEEDQAIMPIYYYVNIDMIDLDRWSGWYANVMGWHPVGDIAAN